MVASMELAAPRVHRLSRPRRRERCSRLRCEACVQLAGQEPSRLWFQVHGRDRHLLTERVDPFLVACLVPAMLQGGRLEVDGEVSDELLWNLNHAVQDYLLQVLPRLQRVQIVSVASSSRWRNLLFKGVVPASSLWQRHGDVALGFSGGVDSFASLCDLYLSGPPRGLRVSRLVFNDCGSHGRRSRASAKLRQWRFRRVRSMARDLNIPLTLMRSNMDSFYQDISFEETYFLRNSACALALSGGISRFFYAPAHDFCSAHLGGAMGSLEPYLAPLFSLKGFSFSVSGFARSRVERLSLLVREPLAHRYLDVCTESPNPASGYVNCGCCPKCVHTLLTLEALGALDLFSGIFDVSSYRRIRDEAVRAIPVEGTLLARAAYAFACERGVIDGGA